MNIKFSLSERINKLYNHLRTRASLKNAFRSGCIILLVIIGGTLRFTNLNWDEFQAFHPDERNISWAVTRIHFFDQLNPKFFAYGGLPVYLYRAIGEAVVRITDDPVWLEDWGHIAVIGRHVSAIFSTATIYLIFIVGATYFSPPVGLVAAFFLTFSPWAIREAHFETTETMLVFFLLFLTYQGFFLAKKPTIRRTIITGIIWGIALAAKTTAASFGIIPILALAFPFFRRHESLRHHAKTILTMIARYILLGTATVVYFIGFSPYTIFDFTEFRASMTYESGVVFGRFTVPYSLQFLHTIPYLTQIATMVWQSGFVILLGLVGMATLIYLVLAKFRPKGDQPWADIARHKEARTEVRYYILFLIFPLTYFALVGGWFAKFNRYNTPFLPFATLAAAWFVVSSLQWLKRHSRNFFFIGLLVYWIIGLFTVWWSLANWSIYLRPQTRIESSEWMFSHIPADTRIYTEHWNDGLPVDVPSVNFVPFNRELLNIYDEPDDESKAAYYAEKLSTGEFIILSTRRMWATFPNLKEKYPVSSKFYIKLLNGELGYTIAAKFTSYPQFLGVAINDDNAEESIQVFDHPTVLIFQNTAHLSPAEIISELKP